MALSTLPVVPVLPVVSTQTANTFNQVANQQPKTITYVQEKFIEYSNNAFQLRSTQTSVEGIGPATTVHTHSFSCKNVKIKALKLFRDMLNCSISQAQLDIYINGNLVQTQDVVSVMAVEDRYITTGIFADDLFKGTNITVVLTYYWSVPNSSGVHRSTLLLEGYRMVEEVTI